MTTAHDLTARLADLLRSERAAMADFLLALADFDRQQLWLELGYPSLFMFLHRELGLSKGAAHYRQTAAALVQRFPEIIDPLRDGRLCLSSILELAKVATPANLGAVLPRFFHRSRREAKEIAVEIRPLEVIPQRDLVTATKPLRAEPGHPALADDAARTTWSQSPPVQLVELDLTHPLQAMPAQGSSPVQAPSPAEAPSPAPSPTQGPWVAQGPSPAQVPPPVLPPATAEPLTSNLRRLHVTVSRRFLAKLERARAALSHSRPGAGAEEILEAGLDLILAAQDRRKGAAARPLEKPRPSKPGHIPASVKREVWKRDQGRCQWPIAGKAGGICGSTLRVEFDHIRPRARGGTSGPEEVRLLCRVHQIVAARQAFGDRWMDQFTRRGRSGSNAPRRNAGGAPAG